MILVCSWCDREMGQKEPLEDCRITHGICVACYRETLADLQARNKKSEKTENAERRLW